MQLYTEPNKYANKPGLIINNKSNNTYVEFEGYQKFKLSKYDILVNPNDKGLLSKQSLFDKSIDPNWLIGKSVLDLGCNSAYFCYYSRLNGAKSAIGVEIDRDYIHNVEKANEVLNFSNVSIIDKNVMDYHKPADVVFAFALIHWIYSCTSDYGSLDLAIKKLAELTNEVLIVEWIEKEDEAIQFFKHINYNTEIIKEEYSKINFEKALAKHFSSFEIIGDVKSTRTVYIAYKSIQTKNYFESFRTGKLNSNDTAIQKFNSIFLGLIKDNKLQNEYNINSKTSESNNLKNNFNLKLSDNKVESEKTPLLTNYTFLSNWELVLKEVDKHYNQTIELLLDTETFEKTISEFENLKNKYVKNIIKNDCLFECIYYFENHIVKINLYKADSNYFPQELINALLGNTTLENYIKILKPKEYVYYLIFKTVYILGAGENAILSEIKDYSIKYNFGLENYNLNNLSFLNQTLETDNCNIENYNLLLNKIALQYIYSPNYVLHSRVIDSSTGRYFISRVYLTANNSESSDNKGKNNNFIITKQANNNLAHKEYGILSSLESDYFPKVKNYNIIDDSSYFEMEFFKGEDLSLLIQNNELSILQKYDISYHLLQVVKYLNNKGIEHRDINPTNVLYDGNKIKVIDFGWSKLIEENTYTPIGLNSEYSPINQIQKYNDLYSVLAIIEDFNSNNELDTEIINEVNEIKKQILNNNLRFSNNVILNIENLLLMKLSEIDKESQITEKYDLNNNQFSVNNLDNSLNNDFDNNIDINDEFYDFKLAIISYKNKDYLSAINHINNALVIHPENEDIFDMYLKISNKINKLDSTVNIIDNNLDKIYHNQNTFKYDVSIIIPVFNKSEYTENCIDYLYQNTSNKYKWEVIVVDNGSTDETNNLFKTKFANNNIYPNLTYIHNEYNMGFAKGCNKGISLKSGKDVILLNNDTLPLPNWFEAIMEEIDADSSIGVAGSCLLYPNTEYVQHCGVRIGTEDGNSIAPYHNQSFLAYSYSLYAQKSKNVSAVTGAVFFIKNEVLDKIGLLDEVYINGLEDIDYCFKASDNGFKIRYCANSILYHYESISEDRHKWNIQNWQRLNRNWIGKIKFDETQYDTILEVNAIKSRKLALTNIDKELMSKMPEKVIFKENNYNIEFSFIIPVHNNLEYTQKCLNSILKHTLDLNKIEVVVINNASDNSTSDYLNSVKNSNLFKNFILISNSNNETYAKVNNQGAKLASGKYLICLNNDIEILNNDWYDELKNTFESNPNIAIQGAKLMYDNGKIQHAGVVWGNVGLDFPLHYHLYLTLNNNEKCVNKTRAFQFVTGAFLTIRKDIFNQINGFDEKYIFGHEDLDLCMKVRDLGFDVIYNHKVEATHYESKTKQLLGVSKFERFISSKDTFDLENHKYFLSKWQNKLVLDAESYLTEDGFWGIISDVDKKQIFQDKIVYLLDKLKSKEVISNPSLYHKVCNIIFKMDNIPTNLDVRLLFALSIDELEKAVNLIDNGNLDNEIVNEIVKENNSVYNSQTLKILITMFGWEESGGGTILPKHMAIALANKGHNVTVIYAAGNHNINQTPYFTEVKRDANVNLIGIFNRQTLFLNIENPELDIEDINIINIFNSVVNEFKPDIIHYNNFLGLSLAINDLVPKTIPTFYSPHNYFMIDPNLYMISSNLTRWENTNFFENSELPSLYTNKIKEYARRQAKSKEVLNNIDYVLATSRKVSQLLSEISGTSENVFLLNHLPNISQIKTDNNNQEYSFNKQTLKVGYIGGVMPHKGIHNLLLAATLIKSNLEIHIYGFVIKSYKDNLDKILNQIPNNIKVIYHGEYEVSELPIILNQVDCITVTSIWEDCAPLVLAESLSQGTPIIGANIGGIPDFVKDGYNGFLYQCDNIHELAEIIENLCNNRKLLEFVANNSKLSYSFDNYINHLIKIYNLALSKDKLKNKDRKELERKELELKFLDENLEYISAYNLDNYSENYSENNNQNKIEGYMEKQSNNVNNNYEQNLSNDPINRLKLDKDLNYGFTNEDAMGKMPYPLPSPLKLNLGCGNDVKNDYLNLDLFSKNPNVIRMDIRNIDLPNNSVDYILASDVLEHFSHRETDKLLSEWARILKPGGEIEIRCPNLRLQLQAYMRGDWNADIASYMIFGGQTNPGDYHCIGFDDNSIKNHLALAGFEVTYFENEDYPQTNGYINLNMVVKARKLVSESSNDYLPVSYSFTKLEPQKGSTYGEVNNYENLDMTQTNFQHINIENVNLEIKNAANPKLNIVWEGTQFVYHSLALVNREQCINLAKSEQVNLTIIPYENNTFDPTENKRYHPIIANDIRYKSDVDSKVLGLPYAWIRHQWPPKNEMPLGAKWILMQPWEFSSIRKDFVEPFMSADEIWTPSNFSRQSFINSGIDSDKIQVIPNGVNPELMTPIGDKYPLKTQKKLKFLFLGGTIPRKGIDILLTAYISTFKSNDNVCLVIKDLGGDSFYRGQTAKKLIEQSQINSDAPEIEYIDDKLSDEQIAALYRSCNVFVSPYRGEGFSLPTLEAMACGLPVVVTKGGATDDYVDESIGWQIPADLLSIGTYIDGYDLVSETFLLEPSEDSLSNILLEIYKNPTSLKSIGLKASYKARTQWTWEKSTLKIFSRLDSLFGTEMSKEAKNKYKEVNDIATKISLADDAVNFGHQDKAEELLKSCINDFNSNYELKQNNLDLYIYVNQLLCMLYLDFIFDDNDLLEIFEQIINEIEILDPKNLDTIFIKSAYYTIVGDLTDALENLTECVGIWNEKRFNSNIGLTLDILLCNSGDILLAMQDYETALQVYQTGLEINNENEKIVFGMGLVYKNTNNLPKAKDYFSMTLDLNPNFQIARDELNQLVNN